MEKPRVVDRKG